MNNLQLALERLKTVIELLDIKWKRPRSEIEQSILDELHSAYMLAESVSDFYEELSRNVRRVD